MVHKRVIPSVTKRNSTSYSTSGKILEINAAVKPRQQHIVTKFALKAGHRLHNLEHTSERKRWKGALIADYSAIGLTKAKNILVQQCKDTLLSETSQSDIINMTVMIYVRSANGAALTNRIPSTCNWFEITHCEASVMKRGFLGSGRSLHPS